MGFIGSGIMARSHMREMIQRDLAEVVAVCEPSVDAYAATVDLFARSGATPPANEPDWQPVRRRLRRSSSTPSSS